MSGSAHLAIIENLIIERGPAPCVRTLVNDPLGDDTDMEFVAHTVDSDAR